jgi:superfamily II DNA/RNA helicase
LGKERRKSEVKYTELKLHPKVQDSVAAQNYENATPIQEGVIPHILSGHDIAGLAQTGTGKTAAFLVPLMDRIVRSIEAAELKKSHATPGSEDVQAAPEVTAEPVEKSHLPPTAPTENRPIFENWRSSQFVLILVPTRELAEQVSENAVKLGGPLGFKTATIYGGTSYETQKAALKSGVQFIVATPGRLIDLFKEHLVDMNQVRAIVFDEADRMFDMGFKDDMKFILRRVPKDRQFLVFSATLNFDVLNTAYEFGANPVEVNVSRDQAKAENVKDELFHVGHYDKPATLLSILNAQKPRQVIIFSNFKHNVERISQFLTSNGWPAMAISSLLTQAQRNRVMELFKAENEKNILVATDLAARGLDIKGVDLVINFDLPDDPENYVHRIGRTGRAGATGLALSLTSERDVEALGRIENYLGHKIPIGWIDDQHIVKDFKPFPNEKRQERPQRDGRHGGGGGPRREGGGPRDNRGPRRDGPPRDGNRDQQRPQHAGGQGPRRDGAPRGEWKDRPPRDGQPRDGQPRDGQNRNDNRGPHQGKRPEHRHEGRHGGGPNRGQNQGPRNGNSQGYQGNKFKHRPGQAPQKTASKNVAATGPSLGKKISKFFKNLFGG